MAKVGTGRIGTSGRKPQFLELERELEVLLKEII